jgi:hypothetical protein
MSRILVSALINFETTLQVDESPVGYYPVRDPFFGINTTIMNIFQSHPENGPEASRLVIGMKLL